MERNFRLINDTWVIKKRVGKGTFSELFLGKNILFKANGQQVAVKLQNDGTEGVVVRHEGDVLRSLGGVPTVPAYIHHGQHNSREYLIMELLGGEDMSSLRDRVRASSGTRLVPLPAAAYLARQMLVCIKNIHDKGYIHRDIKPANFVRRESTSSQFCMIDFGVAKQFRDKQGTLKPKRETAEFRGTVQYASPYVHEGQDQCPRDDLYSLALVFVDLVCGKLPWSEAYRQTKDKQAAFQTKQSYLVNPDSMMNWVAETVIAAERSRAIDPTPAPTSASEKEEGEEEVTVTPLNFPQNVRELTLKIITHLQTLEYESVPDYALIEQAFIDMHPPNHPDVSHSSYNFEGFHWAGGKENRMPEGEEKPTNDPRAMMRLINARGQQLGKMVTKVMRKTVGGKDAAAESHVDFPLETGDYGGSTQNAAPKDGSQTDSQEVPPPPSSSSRRSSAGTSHSEARALEHLTEYASYWAELCDDFLNISDEYVERTVCELLISLVKDSNRFYGIDIKGTKDAAGKDISGKGAIDFSEWVKIQDRTERVADRCSAILRKPKPIQSFS